MICNFSMLGMSKKSVFVAFVEDAISNPQAFNAEKFLGGFPKEISAGWFAGLSADETGELLRNIWSLLLMTSGNQAGTVRLSSYRSIGAFLTKVAPYYPSEIVGAFCETVAGTVIDTKSSVGISSAFAYISTCVSRPKMREFLCSIPVFSHFSTKDPAFSEHIDVIVSNLGHLGMEWLKRLLKYFLEQYEAANSRHVIKAVSAIVMRRPKVFLVDLMEFMGREREGLLSLVSFLVVENERQIDDLDLMPMVKVAMETLTKEDASPADVDCALQLLTVQSTTFSIAADVVENETLSIRAFNDVDDVTATIAFAKVAARPSVYMIKLPLRLLKPGEDESASVVKTKLATLAKDERLDIVDVYDCFEPYLLSTYNDVVSGALRGLVHCLGRFLEGVPKERLIVTLRKALFSESVSWFHSFDVLRVIEKVDIRAFCKVMGRQCFDEVVSAVVGFCFNENRRLAARACSVLRDMTSAYSIEKIVDNVVNQSEYFTIGGLSRSITIMTNVLMKAPDNWDAPSLDIFAKCVIECIWFVSDDLDAMSDVFRFFSLYGLKLPLTELVVLAKCVICGTVTAVSTQALTSTTVKDTKLLKRVREMVDIDIVKRNADVITGPASNYRDFVSPAKAALQFLFAREWTGATGLALDAFQLLPLECTQYFASHWVEIEECEQDRAVTVALSVLTNMSDDAVLSEWCTLYVKYAPLDRTEDMASLRDFLSETAKWYLSDAADIDVGVTVAYVDFLLDMEKDVVVKFLKSVPQITVRQLFDARNSIMLFAKGYIPELVKDYVPIVEATVTTSVEDTEDANLPTDIENDQLQSLFEQYVRHANLQLALKVLQLAGSRHVEISIISIAFPRSFVSSVAACLAVTQPRTFDVQRALALVRTDWRPLALEAIKTDTSLLLETVRSAKKLTKATLINLTSVIDVAVFDWPSLLQFAANLVYEAKSRPRLEATLRFLAVVLSHQETLERSFVSEFVKQMTPKLENADGAGCSSIALLCAQKIPADAPFVAFVKKVVMLCGARTPANGRIQQILITVSGIPALVSRSYISELTEVTLSFLESIVPSRYMAGLRVLEQVNLSISSERLAYVVRPCLEVLANRFIRTSMFPGVPELHFRAVMSLLVKTGVDTLHSGFFMSMPGMFMLNVSHPSFASSIRFWPLVVRLVAKTSDVYLKIMGIGRYLVKNNVGFVIGIRCLKERLAKMEDEERETALMDVLVPWTASTPASADYNLVQRIGGWMSFPDINVSRQALVVLIREVECFWAVFINTAKFAMKHKDNAEFISAIHDTAKYRNRKCHQRALRLLTKVDDVTQLVRLSEFVDDCDASEALFQTFKPADYEDYVEPPEAPQTEPVEAES